VHCFVLLFLDTGRAITVLEMDLLFIQVLQIFHGQSRKTTLASEYPTGSASFCFLAWIEPNASHAPDLDPLYSLKRDGRQISYTPEFSTGPRSWYLSINLFLSLHSKPHFRRVSAGSCSSSHVKKAELDVCRGRRVVHPRASEPHRQAPGPQERLL
jgi:hypothetical protein